MKKDIEWLKNEVNELPLSFLGFSVLKQREDFGVKKDDVLELINQLDEPETLSQEWIEDNEQMVMLTKKGHDDLGNAYSAGTMVKGVPSRNLQNILVPKQELPVLPKFVAEWIEKCKEENKTLSQVYSDLKMSEVDVIRWLYHEGDRSEKVDLLARAWLDGYTEEEQKYYVTDENDTLLCKSNGVVMTVGKLWAIGNEHEAEYDLTEQEIKDYDERYWPFAVKVEELEE